jgi:polysaccharide export outer membrane protein
MLVNCHKKMSKLCLVSAALFSVFFTGCSLPQSGPSSSDIKNDQVLAEYLIIPMSSITSHTPNLTIETYQAHNGISPIVSETLGVGDKVGITIWETAAEGLYTGSSKGSADLGVRVINNQGTINIPYVGNIKASGLTPEQLRLNLTSLLRSKSIDPQVSIRVEERLSKKIIIQGLVTKAGFIELSSNQNSLSNIIALAGPTAQNPDLTEVIVERNGEKIRRILNDIYTTPNANINLLPNDSVVLRALSPRFTVLGATGKQNLVSFPKLNLSLLEAVALSGGLQDELANPEGVYLLRAESQDIVQQLSASEMVGKVGANSSVLPVIYELNMRDPKSLFAAKNFAIRDGDTLIATNASFAQVRKVLSAVSDVTSLTRAATAF